MSTPTPEHNPSAALLSPADVCRRLLGRELDTGAARVAFWRAVRAWRIPFYRIGPKTIRFSEADLNCWLEKRRVGPKGKAA